MTSTATPGPYIWPTPAHWSEAAQAQEVPWDVPLRHPRRRPAKEVRGGKCKREKDTSHLWPPYLVISTRDAECDHLPLKCSLKEAGRPGRPESREAGLDIAAAATKSHALKSWAKEEHSQLTVRRLPDTFLREAFPDHHAGQVPLLCPHSPQLITKVQLLPRCEFWLCHLLAVCSWQVT